MQATPPTPSHASMNSDHGSDEDDDIVTLDQMVAGVAQNTLSTEPPPILPPPENYPGNDHPPTPPAWNDVSMDAHIRKMLQEGSSQEAATDPSLPDRTCFGQTVHLLGAPFRALKQAYIKEREQTERVPESVEDQGEVSVTTNPQYGKPMPRQPSVDSFDDIEFPQDMSDKLKEHNVAPQEKPSTSSPSKLKLIKNAISDAFNKANPFKKDLVRRAPPQSLDRDETASLAPGETPHRLVTSPSFTTVNSSDLGFDHHLAVNAPHDEPDNTQNPANGIAPLNQHNLPQLGSGSIHTADDQHSVTSRKSTTTAYTASTQASHSTGVSSPSQAASTTTPLFADHIMIQGQSSTFTVKDSKGNEYHVWGSRIDENGNAVAFFDYNQNKAAFDTYFAKTLEGTNSLPTEVGQEFIYRFYSATQEIIKVDPKTNRETVCGDQSTYASYDSCKDTFFKSLDDEEEEEALSVAASQVNTPRNRTSSFSSSSTGVNAPLPNDKITITLRQPPPPVTRSPSI